jgi:hypothetical protein
MEEDKQEHRKLLTDAWETLIEVQQLIDKNNSLGQQIRSDIKNIEEYLKRTQSR